MLRRGVFPPSSPLPATSVFPTPSYAKSPSSGTCCAVYSPSFASAVMKAPLLSSHLSMHSQSGDCNPTSCPASSAGSSTYLIAHRLSFSAASTACQEEAAGPIPPPSETDKPAQHHALPPPFPPLPVSTSPPSLPSFPSCPFLAPLPFPATVEASPINCGGQDLGLLSMRVRAMEDLQTLPLLPTRPTALSASTSSLSRRPCRPKAQLAIPASCRSQYPSARLLKYLTADVEKGLVAGNDLIMAELSCSGAYFCRNATGRLVGVFKPMDEEPYAVNNPRLEYRPRAKGNGERGGRDTGRREGLKAGVAPGKAAVREAAAFVLDEGFAGVPATALVSLRRSRTEESMSLEPLQPLHHLSPPPLRKTESVGEVGRVKVGSLQQYVRHVGCADDYGPGRFAEEDVQRVALLDLRLLNSDRNAGNILVAPPDMLLPGGEMDGRGDRGKGGSRGGSDTSELSEVLVCRGPSFASASTKPSPLFVAAVQKTQEQQQRDELLRHVDTEDLRGLPPSPPFSPPPPHADPCARSLDLAMDKSAPLSPMGLRRTQSVDVLERGEGTLLARRPSIRSHPVSLSLSSSASLSSPHSTPSRPSWASTSPYRMLIRHRRLLDAAGRKKTKRREPFSEESASGIEGEEREDGASPLCLLPIDHGFCLPHPLLMDDVELCWVNWEAAKVPLLPSLRQHLSTLTVEDDIARLKACLGDVAVEGEGLPPTCFLTLRIGTALLQEGLLVRRGPGQGGEGEGEERAEQAFPLTLHDLALLVTREDPECPSELEQAVRDSYEALVTEVSDDLLPSRPVAWLPWENSLIEDERLHPRFMELFKPRLRAILDKAAEGKVNERKTGLTQVAGGRTW